MPEQPVPTALYKALDNLEDNSLSTNKQKCANYEEIQTVLRSDCDIPEPALKRLLVVCNHDLKEDLKFATHVINTITIILKNVKSGKYATVPELLSSALAILHIIQTTALLSKVQALQSLCFEAFLSFPDETYVELATKNDAELMELFSLFFHQGMPAAIKLMPFDILMKILKSLPPENRRGFTEQGVSVWFSKLVPVSVTILMNNDATSKVLDVLELITDELEHIDYSDNSQWMNILDCISQSKKYPAIMKTLLENGKESWCRLWNIFVRLLKQQITMNKSKSGSPINSMLPVVETAFKMDITNRCRAFQCWSVLVDNFSTESNEMIINKRVKLLIIPLRSNNAKVEQTALAKFDTWWHLIRKFQPRMDTLADIIYIPFLYFCFGNPKQAQDSNVLIPGMLSLKMQKLCLQALVESTGHVGCEGCIDQTFPRLSRRILSPKQLKEHAGDWTHILKCVIRTCGSRGRDLYNETVKQQVRCIWKSFLLMLTRLVESNRKVILNDLLDWLPQLMEAAKAEIDTLDLIYNVLLKSCFEDAQTKSLFNSKDRWNDIDAPLPKILSVLLHPSMQQFYTSTSSSLTPFMNAVVDSSMTSPDNMLAWLLPRLPASDPGLMLWTALVTTVQETSGLNGDTLTNVLLWPLKHMQQFGNVQQAAFAWNAAYTSLKSKLTYTSIEKDISLLLLSNKTTSQFSLYALLQILKSVLEDQNSTDCKIEAELLVKVLAKIKDVDTVMTMFPVIVDSLVLMATKVVKDQSSLLAEFTLTATKSLLKLIMRAKKGSKVDNYYHMHLEKLLKSINDLYQANDDFIKFKSITTEQLIECCTEFQEYPAVKNTAGSILKTFFSKCKEDEEPIYSMLKTAIDGFNNSEKHGTDPKFVAPEKGKAKKTRKKQPNIVNTVVENGEEYAVIKSNWKFNPKKLTENQREKFQKKREDIPALYQDLSQSQDEFKLASWKTDSQDASSTSASSKSTSTAGHTDASTVLLKMASAEMVPKIMENIFSDSNKEANQKKSEPANENDNMDTTSPKANRITALSTPKQPKSPRMALKDRVFQNVRNLIEKSSLPGEVKSPKSKELNQTSIEAAPRTPMPKSTNETNATYSAPPKLSSDRPSRMKRKPKKYESDFLHLALSKKKRRNSASDLQRDEDSDENAMSQDADEDGKQTVVEAVVHEEPNKILSPEREPEGGTQEEPIVKAQPISKTIDSAKAKCDVIVIDDEEEIVEETQKPKTPEEIVPATTKVSDAPEDAQDDDVEEIIEARSSPSPEDIAVNSQQETDKTKSTKKKTSRIEKELAIDMVEGHPFLKVASEKRTTRKSAIGTVNSTRRKNLTEKLNKALSKSESKVDAKKKIDLNKPKVADEKNVDAVKELFKVKETQDSISTSTDDMPGESEDFIESSQDSTFTTISMKSTKSITKKQPVVKVDRLDLKGKYGIETQSLLESSSDTSTDILCTNQGTKDDIEFPQNKSVPQENDLTADMDTEPMVDKKVTITSSDNVIVITDHVETIEVNTDNRGTILETQEEDTSNVDTQDTANADTQLMDPNFLASQQEQQLTRKTIGSTSGSGNNVVEIVVSSTEEPMDIAVTKESAEDSETGLSSPFKDEEQRNKDFLNNTLEISPIKTMSPIKDTKTQTSPETSSDYVVINLSSPVQGDGETFEKIDSPEIFTEDKVSPDKRDQSPPREGTSTSTGSPSSSLSLKKNRPQVRPSGRAAQMLGLCVPDRLSFKTNEKPVETEEPKKTTLTPARRNLRILYNCEHSETGEESEESETFLRFKKSLPTADSSPSGPILKRKLAEMADETTMSPASKRKRVSFHDPPVSTTISVHKYIEPLSLMRSPQSSTKKQERLTRQATMKAPKKLETIFIQTSALTELAKTVESIADATTCSEDLSSLEQTPAVEVVQTTDLNDTDPICPGLLECKDPISNIASDLSSPAMKTLLIKELEGIVETVGDLAKMSELEVNRLCIKAPKVKVAKKVLSTYEKVLSECASKTIEVAMSETDNQTVEDIDPIETSEPKEIQAEILSTSDMEIQTDDPPVTVLATVETQTSKLSVTASHTQTSSVAVATTETQTKKVSMASCKVQTNESGAQSTKDVVTSCLIERPDYVNEISAQMDVEAKTTIADSLPLHSIIELIAKNLSSPTDSELVLETVLRKQDSNDSTSKNSLVFLQEYLAKTYGTSDLILFCSWLLKNIHDKPVV